MISLDMLLLTIISVRSFTVRVTEVSDVGSISMYIHLFITSFWTYKWLGVLSSYESIHSILFTNLFLLFSF